MMKKTNQEAGMKKKMMLMIGCVLFLVVVGCGARKTAKSDVKETEVKETTQTEKEDWSEQDIISMFDNVKDDGMEYIDCAVMEDKAYDFIGTVLYWNEDEKIARVAFFDKDGHKQSCGFPVKIADDSNFTYLGDGNVSFQIETEKGEVSNYGVITTKSGSDIYFTTIDELQE